MNKYRVNVNGTSYEVEIELIEEGAAPAAPANTSAPVSGTAAAGNGEKVTSPMPGTILSVNAENGKNVKKGDVLFILEAMKMENEIVAPADGVVSSLSVAKGAAVESGALLCVIA